MKNVSRTFLLIGAILSLLAFFGFIIGGVVCIYTSKTVTIDTIRELLEKIELWYFVAGEGEERARFILPALELSGYFFIFCGILAIPTAVLAFVGRNKPTTGVLVTIIVMGIVAWNTIFVILGAIFALVANGQERKKQEKAIEQQ